jgi:hypothetical protein
VRVRDNLVGSYPKSVYSEFNVIFSKELFSPHLCLFVKLATFYSSEQSNSSKSSYITILSLKKSKLEILQRLSQIVSKTPLERLIFNELEPNLNVMDADQKDECLSIHLSDNLKTIVNHLVPHLKHQISSIQLCAYQVLKNLMVNMSNYYEIKNKKEEDEAIADEADDDTSKQILNIFESLPFIIRQTYFELTSIFADLKTSVHFDQNILITTINNSHEVESTTIESKKYETIGEENLNYYLNTNSIKLKEIRHDMNNKLMSYLILNQLILDMFANENLEFKVKLVNHLREINFNDYLMNCLFRTMPALANSSIKLFESMNNQQLNEFDDIYYLVNNSGSSVSVCNESHLNKNVQVFACRLYKKALKCVPAMIRDWWNIQPKRIADQVKL